MKCKIAPLISGFVSVLSEWIVELPLWFIWFCECFVGVNCKIAYLVVRVFSLHLREKCPDFGTLKKCPSVYTCISYDSYRYEIYLCIVHLMDIPI